MNDAEEAIIVEMTENTSHRRGDILQVAVCEKCRVIYKLRSGDEQPPNGVHHCRECGARIDLGVKAPLRFSGAGG